MKNFKGLSQREVEESRQKNGNNEFSVKKRTTFLKTYWGKFDDPIIIVLLLALGINIIFTFFGKVDLYECAGILCSVIISTFVSALSEFKNENTFQKLQDEASNILCKVYRDGELKEVSISELVVDDIVLLQTGDMVPADGEICAGHIMVDQSSLNGENKEIKKMSTSVSPVAKLRGVDFWNNHSLYRGSMVCSGECTMRIDAVGDLTVYGGMTHETQGEIPDSPLTIKLRQLAKSISKFGYWSAILLIVFTFFQNAFLDQGFQPYAIAEYFRDSGQVISDLVSSLIIGIIVIVVAVPEGLPLMIAIVCSINMKKMLKSKVLVRKLIGIETSGSINILFSDKTGTITKGKLDVIGFLDGGANKYESFLKIPKLLRDLAGISIMANTSAHFSGKKIVGGNATEKALLRFVGADSAHMEGIDVLTNIPFQSEKKFSATQIGGACDLTLVKGAPEILLPRCKMRYNDSGVPIMIEDMGNLERELNNLAKGAVRLLALTATTEKLLRDELPNEMVLVGILAIRDEVRRDAKSAIEEVKRAGIQVVMITGDRKETAVAIAKDAGLLTDKYDLVLTSAELNKMSDNKVKEVLPKLRVLARALPTDKSRLVRLAQEEGLVVGMTGDGVNDTPALKCADVGFAMGSGSEVAKEAGDIVILDDNFMSIRNAILYGRTIYKSIKRFIQFQLTINVAAATISILGPIAGIEKPLDISQMIWTNLMIDSLAAIAFGGEPALKRYLMERPKRRTESILDSEMWSSIIWNGLYICALSLFIFISPRLHNCFRTGVNDIYFYTGYFTFFIFICIFNGFNARTDSIDLLENLALNKQFLIVMGGIGLAQVVMTYYGGAILRTAGLVPSEWLIVLSLAITIIPLDLCRKLIRRRKSSIIN